MKVLGQYPTLILLAIVLAACAPAAAAPLTSTPDPFQPTPVVTSRGPNLVASDPGTVVLGAGTPAVVEFFRFT